MYVSNIEVFRSLSEEEKTNSNNMDVTHVESKNYNFSF